MSNIRSINGQIVTKPFEARQVRTTITSGFAMVEQKYALTELEVLYHYRSKDGLILEPGDTVFVNGQDARLAYGTNIWDYEDQKFIVVPEDRVVMIKKLTPKLYGYADQPVNGDWESGHHRLSLLPSDHHQFRHVTDLTNPHYIGNDGHPQYKHSTTNTTTDSGEDK